MKKSLLVTCAGAALFLSIGSGGGVLAADNGSAKPPTMGSTKPHLGNGPADETSLPSSASPATTTAKTGASDQNHTVKTMNDAAKSKVETEGK